MPKLLKISKWFIFEKYLFKLTKFWFILKEEEDLSEDEEIVYARSVPLEGKINEEGGNDEKSRRSW